MKDIEILPAYDIQGKHAVVNHVIISRSHDISFTYRTAIQSHLFINFRTYHV